MSIDTSKLASQGPNPNLARNTYTREKAQSDVDALAGDILAVAKSDVNDKGIILTKINKYNAQPEENGEDKTLGGMLFAHLANIGAKVVYANGNLGKNVDTNSTTVPDVPEKGVTK